MVMVVSYNLAVGGACAVNTLQAGGAMRVPSSRITLPRDGLNDKLQLSVRAKTENLEKTITHTQQPQTRARLLGTRVYTSIPCRPHTKYNSYYSTQHVQQQYEYS